MKEGWICPRCGKVNAPFIVSCDCKPDGPFSNANSKCGCGCEHEWNIIGEWSNTVGNGVTLICKKCGQTKDIVYS